MASIETRRFEQPDQTLDFKRHFFDIPPGRTGFVPGSHRAEIALLAAPTGS